VVETAQFPTIRLWAEASLGEDSDKKTMAKIGTIFIEFVANCTRRGKFIGTSANYLVTSFFYTLNRLRIFIGNEE
jgi:hypothetical protein